MPNVFRTLKQWVFKTSVRHQYGDSKKPCLHRDLIQQVTPRTPQGCEECLAIGDSWVHLRLCLICGHVSCCDNSKNKHATQHFHVTEHPIIRSFQPGEDWQWCYVDQVLIGKKVSADAAHSLFQALLPNDARTIYTFQKALLRHGQGICGLGAPAVIGVRLSICATTTLQWCDQSKVCATFLKVQDEMGSII